MSLHPDRPDRTAGTPAGSWRSEFPATDLGSFVRDVQSDEWTWSEEVYELHGYRPGAVVPTLDLVLHHKVAEDRRRAERLFSHSVAPDFRFRHLHHITDAVGRRREVLSIGAAGEQRTGDGELRPVVRGFMLDMTGLPRSVQQHALAAVPDAQPPVAVVLAGLTERELDVLRLIAQGRTNDEIARELFVSINTVKTYVRSSYRKIGVNRRPQAILWFLDLDDGSAEGSLDGADSGLVG